MTAEEFTRNEGDRNELARVLSNPVLQQAFAVLLDGMSPSSVNPGVADPAVAASLFQQIAGANHIVRSLSKLTQPPVRKVDLRVPRLRDETLPTQ